MNRDDPVVSPGVYPHRQHLALTMRLTSPCAPRLRAGRHPERGQDHHDPSKTYDRSVCRDSSTCMAVGLSGCLSERCGPSRFTNHVVSQSEASRFVNIHQRHLSWPRSESGPYEPHASGSELLLVAATLALPLLLGLLGRQRRRVVGRLVPVLARLGACVLHVGLVLIALASFPP